MCYRDERSSIRPAIYPDTFNTWISLFKSIEVSLDSTRYVPLLNRGVKREILPVTTLIALVNVEAIGSNSGHKECG
jgi:hypothetical protein